MANKYLKIGNTFNGDGTTSADAGSNGGVGAWNQSSILTGTAPAFGSLTPGDVIYIRSKTAANADIVIAAAANITIGSNNGAPASGTEYTWILDGGTVWAGVAGTLTFQLSSTFIASSQNWNRWIAYAADKFILQETNNTASNKTWFQGGIGCEFTNWYFDLQGTGYSNCKLHAGFGCTWRNPHVKMGAHSNYVFAGANAFTTFVNPDIELATNENQPVFAPSSSYQIRVMGGQIRGAGPSAGGTSGLKVADLSDGVFEGFGLQYPSAMLTDSSGNTGQTYRGLRLMGVDGVLGAIKTEQWGNMSSRSDGFFPTLNSILPVSGTGWSWYVYPKNAGKLAAQQCRIEGMLMYGDAAATKTITAAFLVATGFTALNKSNCFLEVCYVDDSTGLVKYLSTEDPAGGSLTSSSLSWSATTYGAVNFNKREAAVTTPTTIKQYTPICWALVINKASTSANDILFVDNDPQLS